MKVLIADDSESYRLMLNRLVTGWGYEVIEAIDGEDALNKIAGEPRVELIMLDWEMPKIDGIALCKIIKGDPVLKYLYTIMLTSKNSRNEIVTGLDSGANDYITKPFETGELKARIGVGRRVVELQRELSDKIRELSETLSEVKTLKGLLPICSHCKKIRDDGNYWRRVEEYFARYAGAEFTHSICPDCLEKYYPTVRKIKE